MKYFPDQRLCFGRLQLIQGEKNLKIGETMLSMVNITTKPA